MSKSNAKSIGIEAKAVQIMESMKDRSMAETCQVMASTVYVKSGKLMTMNRARGCYRYLVRQGRAPGNIERAVKVSKEVKVKAEKTPKVKAEKTPKVKAEKAPKAPVERKDVLHAAAKRAGIHKDSIAEVTGGDDPLNLAAPESLSKDDLKNLL